ncbi:hypothetical protein NKL07_19065 [Mesorhizobium sp. C280B]|uniref:hypothetical protein n=1 Tax=Mesorhizobium sp. LSJC280B00 TaxID=1287336 RepID=UPI0003CF74EB|nr:hypothetical protein [Mesorhizobium sp. LSJC280B00]ESW79288.1 hypothetical protein X772_27905 [Mesorhizobium sp. LSJC280B00]
MVQVNQIVIGTQGVAGQRHSEALAYGVSGLTPCFVGAEEKKIAIAQMETRNPLAGTPDREMRQTRAKATSIMGSRPRSAAMPMPRSGISAAVR